MDERLPDEPPARACCDRPSVVNHDYAYPEQTMNRMCLRCGVHWFKDKIYSRADWETWVNSLHSEDATNER